MSRVSPSELSWSEVAPVRWPFDASALDADRALARAAIAEAGSDPHAIEEHIANSSWWTPRGIRSGPSA